MTTSSSINFGEGKWPDPTRQIIRRFLRNLRIVAGVSRQEPLNFVAFWMQKQPIDYPESFCVYPASLPKGVNALADASRAKFNVGKSDKKTSGRGLNPSAGRGW